MLLAAQPAATTTAVPKGRPPESTLAPDTLAALRFFALRTQINAERHAQALRCFEPKEFGDSAHAPSSAHIDAVNRMLKAAHAGQTNEQAALTRACRDVAHGSGEKSYDAMLRLKEWHQSYSGQTEQLWDFYFNIFNQRRGPFARLLSSMDRVALDCYQAVYLGLGRARSIPSPAPYTYLETGFGPATFRRGVKMSKLGSRPNPFPLVKVPLHRLINPWSLGAIPHEVSHNLQSDLGLWELMPRRVRECFAKSGLPKENAAVWARWHKESYADLAGTLLIGPAYVGSLMDVVGRARSHTASYSDDSVHPTPIIRVPLNIHLLERMGFRADAQFFRTAWNRLYPSSSWSRIPAWVRKGLPEQISAMVQAVCLTPEREYGGKRLIDVVRFEPKHALLVQEAAVRLESGLSTGVLPERFLIAATRLALARRKGNPATIYENFYATLERS